MTEQPDASNPWFQTNQPKTTFDQPDWITPVPTPRVGVQAQPISFVPVDGEFGVHDWLRRLARALEHELRGPTASMLIADSHPQDVPWAWFFAATIAGHRIHITGYAADPSDPQSDTQFAIAIDELQLAYHPRSKPDLLLEIAFHLRLAHEHIAHRNHTHLDTRPVPLISYGPEAAAFADRYQAAMIHADEEHRELFTAIREATGLEPSIWQSGGMTMTIYIPLPTTTLPKGSHYLGLVEGWAENGDAAGSVSLYFEDGEEERKLIFYASNAQPVSDWAEAIARHYRSVQQSPTSNKVEEGASTETDPEQQS